MDEWDLSKRYFKGGKKTLPSYGDPRQFKEFKTKSIRIYKKNLSLSDVF